MFLLCFVLLVSFLEVILRAVFSFIKVGSNIQTQILVIDKELRQVLNQVAREWYFWKKVDRSSVYQEIPFIS